MGGGSSIWSVQLDAAHYWIIHPLSLFWQTIDRDFTSAFYLKPIQIVVCLTKRKKRSLNIFETHRHVFVQNPRRLDTHAREILTRCGAWYLNQIVLYDVDILYIIKCSIQNYDYKTITVISSCHHVDYIILIDYISVVIVIITRGTKRLCMWRFYLKTKPKIINI